MRKLALITGLVAAATLALPVAAWAAGGKPPVKLEGKVNDEGTKTVKKSSIDLEEDDFYFKATYIKTKAGKTLTVKLENEGGATHTFTVDSLDIDKELQPGKKATVKVDVPDTGSVAFYCRFHKGQGMQGAIFSKAGAALASAQSSTGSTPTTKAPSTTAGSSGYGY